jgi:hypothetical protein
MEENLYAPPKALVADAGIFIGLIMLGLAQTVPPHR